MDNKEINGSDNNNMKTLWVLLSALGLLIIVGSAGFIFFSPDKNAEELKPVLAATTPVPVTIEEIDPIELSRDNEEIPGLLESSDDGIEIELIDEDLPVVEETVVEDVEEQALTPVVKAAEPEFKEIKVDVFWIQVGSYSSLTKAESVSTSLKEKGITTTVQTKNVDDKAVFRVRIGAFNTKEEANKFSAQVKELKGFEESYVVQSTLTKKIPVNS